MARIVVSGYMVRHPMAGNIYAYLHYLAGLRRLGHDVVYVEESGWGEACYDPGAFAYSDDPGRGLAIVDRIPRLHGVDGVTVAYVDPITDRSWGLERHEVAGALRACDLLLNIGGVCWLPEFEEARRRALVDMDPLFTQTGQFAFDTLEHHDTHFTYGTNVGRPGCDVPTNGIDWQPTVPPVVPAMWRLGPPPTDGPFTTIANWSAYDAVEVDGRHYGQKDEEFLRLADLPRLAGVPVQAAIAGGDRRVEKLRVGGWSIGNAGDLVPDVRRYRAFVARSRAELSPAKHAYVAARTGWVSDRTVCYLAAGRPAVVQDTGLDDRCGVGAGLLTFVSADDAATAVETVVADYESHSRAARRLARTVFGFDVVLPRLLECAGAAR